ncbi:MAG: hypothetical protein ACPGO5_04555 [Patescibacteria group bacterium]
MALNKETQKNILLAVVMIVAIGGTLFFVNKNSDTSDRRSLEDTLNPVGSSGVPQRVEDDIFESDEFNELEDYSPVSFPLEPKGRENPFTPFTIE